MNKFIYVYNWTKLQTDETLQEVFDFYPKVNATGSPFTTEYDRAWTIAGDVIFTCMCVLTCELSMICGLSGALFLGINSSQILLCRRVLRMSFLSGSQIRQFASLFSKAYLVNTVQMEHAKSGPARCVSVPRCYAYIRPVLSI